MRHEDPNAIPSQSLTFALHVVAGQARYEIDHDDLNAALGLSWMICVNRDEPNVGLWSMYARDAFLIEAGRLFGMQIREIHTPEAARGLDVVAELDQHFDASYRPLIHRALEHGQPVLAWQGWPGDRERSWGVIREKCAEGANVDSPADPTLRCGTNHAASTEQRRTPHRLAHPREDCVRQ